MNPDRRRWAALIVLCTGMLMIVLDLTVVNVALPAIQHDLHFSDAGLAWVVNAYMIAFGGLLALFVLRERAAAQPLVPLGIFRSRTVAGANIVQVLGVAGMFGIFFLGSLYLKKVLGYDAMQIGLAFLPTTAPMGALSVRFTEPLVTRFGARPVMVAGLVLIGLGLVAFTRAPVDASYAVHILPVMVLLGVGAGLAFPALMTLAMSGVTGENAGLASGLVNTTAQVGAALGLAVLATPSAGRATALAAHGAGARAGVRLRRGR